MISSDVAARPIGFRTSWLLTQDSKATALTRLMFAMRPWYASEPRQLGGARVASVIDPITVSRAWALQVLLDGSGEHESRASGARVGATACRRGSADSGAMDSPGRALAGGLQ